MDEAWEVAIEDLRREFEDKLEDVRTDLDDLRQRVSG